MPEDARKRPAQPVDGSASPGSAARGRKRPAQRVDESGSPGSVARGRSRSGPTSRLTRRRLSQGEASLRSCGPVRLRGSIGGRTVCLPDVSSLERDWTVPAWYTVADIVGQLAFMVGEDSGRGSEGATCRISAVIVSRHGCVAPSPFELSQCADGQNFVEVVCGAQPVRFAGMPAEERALIDLSDVATPVTPGSSSS